MPVPQKDTEPHGPRYPGAEPEEARLPLLTEHIWAPSRRRLGYPYAMNTSRIRPVFFYSYARGGSVTPTYKTYLGAQPKEARLPLRNEHFQNKTRVLL
jgi:hypothetical protein